MRFPWSRESRLLCKVEEVAMSLSVLNNKLAARVDQMSRRSKELFEACVRAKEEGDVERASLYASELSQLRRAINKTLSCQLSLEAVTYRLATIKDLGDARLALLPLKNIVSKVGRELHGVLPETGGNVSRIQELVEEVTLELGTVDDGSPNIVEASDDEARRILEEAAAVASRRPTRK